MAYRLDSVNGRRNHRRLSVEKMVREAGSSPRERLNLQILTTMDEDQFQRRNFGNLSLGVKPLAGVRARKIHLRSLPLHLKPSDGRSMIFK